jgi:3',5'-cyclic AMP phosphodiesterase CpdA
VRVIAHLSDLHFGRVDPDTLPALQNMLIAVRSDVLVVSGDLTHRARRREFEAARRPRLELRAARQSAHHVVAGIIAVLEQGAAQFGGIGQLTDGLRCASPHAFMRFRTAVTAWSCPVHQ